MLRGPQTAAELYSRAERMFVFDDLAAVEVILESLATTATPPLVMKLPRQPGQRERGYAHLLAGEPVLAAALEPPTADQMSVTVALVADKIAQLETEIDRLRQQIAGLRQQLDAFRKQFE